MSDADTNVESLRALVRTFVEERDWRQFHAPKNIAMALAVEAAELMEHFQWLTVDQSRALADEPAQLADVAEELADVVSYALALANSLQIDLSSSVHDKMRKNADKYPADKYRGRYG